MAREDDAQNITEDPGQLDSGLLEHLVDTIDQLGAILQQMHAQPRQIAQILLGLIRHKAGSQQSMLKQVREPLRILHIRLATWHPLQMACIDQDQLAVSGKPISYRTPEHSRALHPHMRASCFEQPLP